MNKLTDKPEAAEPNAADSGVTDRILPLSGLDRGGLGEKGWAEVPDDLIGGDPELEVAPPGMDPVTGAATQADDSKKI